MLAMLVVATALARVTFPHSLPSEERSHSNYLAKGIFSEDDMTPEFTEQLGHHDHESDIKKRNNDDKYEIPKPTHKPEVENTTNEQFGHHDLESDIKKIYHDHNFEFLKHQHKTNVTNTTKDSQSKSSGGHSPPEKNKKRQQIEDIDVADREDHITQHLADLLVNTDSEITSLQASELDDEREGFEVKEDMFFTFLTGQEKAVEVDGAWSKPTDEDLQNEDHASHLLADSVV